MAPAAQRSIHDEQRGDRGLTRPIRFNRLLSQLARADGLFQQPNTGRSQGRRSSVQGCGIARRIRWVPWGNPNDHAFASACQQHAVLVEQITPRSLTPQRLPLRAAKAAVMPATTVGVDAQVIAPANAYAVKFESRTRDTLASWPPWGFLIRAGGAAAWRTCCVRVCV